MADIDNFVIDNHIEMPFSMEAEQAVLGSILTDPSCLKNIMVYLNTESFFVPQHQEIYRTILMLDSTNQQIDVLVVIDDLVRRGVYDSAAARAYLLQISQLVPTTANVEKYAQIVKENSLIRTLISVSGETIDNAVSRSQTADELLDEAESRIYKIRQGKKSDDPSRLLDIITGDVCDRLQKLSGEDRDLYKGLTTGFSDLDKVLSGLNKSDFILIGARPAMGKTSFALNLARNVAGLSKKRVLFFSLEMTKEQLAQRVLATEARVSSSKMRSGELTADDWTKIGTAISALSDCELYFDDSSIITVPEMKAKIRRVSGGVDCVVIDYLGLITGTGKSKEQNRVNEVSEITRNLKMMAKDLNIPVVCCAQLSRGTEGRGKSHRPQLADLRESGSIEQDADIVLMLYRPDYYAGEKDDNDNDENENPDVNKVEVIVAKNRHGETGTVEFIWDAEHTLFIPVEKLRNDM